MEQGVEEATASLLKPESMMSTLTLPRKVHFRSLLNELGRQVAPGHFPGAIDLSEADWVHPSGLAALAALVSLTKEHHDVSWLNANTERCRAFRYFQDMDFFRQFEVFADEDFNRRNENLAFARLVSVDWQADSSQIARNLSKLVSQHAKPIYNDFFTCIEESVRNVIDHARKPGFAVAQSRWEPGGERSYNIAICDYGRGVASGLADNSALRVADDADALKVACQKGTSGAIKSRGPGEDQVNFGVGLFQIDKVAESTNGRFILGSGEAVRIRDADGVRYQQVPHWQGTSVEITLYLSGFRSVHRPQTSSGRLRFG